MDAHEAPEQQRGVAGGHEREQEDEPRVLEQLEEHEARLLLLLLQARHVHHSCERECEETCSAVGTQRTPQAGFERTHTVRLENRQEVVRRHHLVCLENGWQCDRVSHVELRLGVRLEHLAHPAEALHVLARQRRQEAAVAAALRSVQYEYPRRTHRSKDCALAHIEQGVQSVQQEAVDAEQLGWLVLLVGGGRRVGGRRVGRFADVRLSVRRQRPPE